MSRPINADVIRIVVRDSPSRYESDAKFMRGAKAHLVRAVKPHVCEFCHHEIAEGERYYHANAFLVVKACLRCAATRRATQA